MQTETIGVIIAIVGCFIGLAGWLKGRDSKIANDSEWKGTVNAKLDNILGFGKEIDYLNDICQKSTNRLSTLEGSTAFAHQRIDRIERIERIENIAKI